MQVVREMRIPPAEVVWGSLLNGCKIHGRTDLAEFGVKRLIDIDPNNGGYRIMLANVYSELRKWDDFGMSVYSLLVYSFQGCLPSPSETVLYQSTMSFLILN